MSFAAIGEIPGRVRRRSEVRAPAGYAVFDCETTGTSPGRDEIVSLALVRLDGDGVEVARLATLVRPEQPIPPEATAVNGVSDADVAAAPRFAEVAAAVVRQLEGAVFVAHNAPFDLAMLRHALAGCGIDYRPDRVACTLAAFRLLEPLEAAHGLEAVCARHRVALDAHDALGDALATAVLLRLVLAAGLAPETVELDQGALWRLRSRGDTRPATEGQIRRVFALGNAAGLDRARLLALVARVAGTDEVDTLTREGVQDVFDALEGLMAAQAA
jgi:DNA polymerase III epsilon subunit family exonuclease